MLMICLTLDTAGTACSACLYDSQKDVVLGEISEEIGKGHAERLMDIIADVMALANITYQDIDRIVTTTGPGSFTGIRVGVATARGFGIGLNIPVIGISNLEAILDELTHDMAKDDLLKEVKILGVVNLAGRGQVYCLLNFASEFADPMVPFVADTADVKAALAKQASQFVLCGTAADEIIGTDHPTGAVSTKQYHRASISVVARLGARSNETLVKPEPLYLRKPDAVPQKGFAVERAE